MHVCVCVFSSLSNSLVSSSSSSLVSFSSLFISPSLPFPFLPCSYCSFKSDSLLFPTPTCLLFIFPSLVFLPFPLLLLTSCILFLCLSFLSLPFFSSFTFSCFPFRPFRALPLYSSPFFSLSFLPLPFPFLSPFLSHYFASLHPISFQLYVYLISSAPAATYRLLFDLLCSKRQRQTPLHPSVLLLSHRCCGHSLNASVIQRPSLSSSKGIVSHNSSISSGGSGKVVCSWLLVTQ